MKNFKIPATMFQFSFTRLSWMFFALVCALLSCQGGRNGNKDVKPLNVIYIMADDHAYQAVSAYGSDLADLVIVTTIINHQMS